MSDPSHSLVAHLVGHARDLINAAILAGVGLLIGLGQLLRSKEPLSWRTVFGRALCSGGLGAAAATALLWAPDLPFVAQLGIAAALASLGTSALEKILNRALGGSQS